MVKSVGGQGGVFAQEVESEEWRRRQPSSGAGGAEARAGSTRARTWAAAAGGRWGLHGCSRLLRSLARLQRQAAAIRSPLVSQQGKLKAIIKDEKRPGAAEKEEEGVCDMLLTGPDSASHLCGEPRGRAATGLHSTLPGALPAPRPGPAHGTLGCTPRPGACTPPSHIISIRIQTCYYSSQAEETKHNPLKLTFQLGY